jgi:hypothetical protein
MNELKIGDEVKVVYMPHSYRGDYKQGMIGKIIEVSRRGRQLKLHGDNIKVNELWLDAEGVKLVESNKYPNPPLPHCEERIALAMGANIEVLTSGTWCYIGNPQFHKCVKYRVKVEKTKDDLRIEELYERVQILISELNDLNEEIAELEKIND